MIRLVKTTTVVLATLLGIAAVWELSGPVLVLLVSLVIAAATRVPIEYLVARGLPKYAAVAGLYLVILLIVSGFLLTAIYMVSGELRRAPDDFTKLYDYAASHSTLAPWIERALKEPIPLAEELLTKLVGNHGEQAFRILLGTAFSLFSALIDAVFVVVLSIYWTIDREYFAQIWLSLLPLPHRISMRNLGRVLETELGAYARSELTQSLLAGLLLGAGFYLLGIQYPAMLALTGALSWLIPWFGVVITLLAMAIAELPALVLGWPGTALPVIAAAVYTVGVFATLEFAVEPRLFNRRRYNSLLIVVAAMALGKILGVLGLLLGPMLAVAIQIVIEHVEREQVSLPNPVADWSALEGRIEEIRSRAAIDDELPKEWFSILDRLAVLTAQARVASEK